MLDKDFFTLQTPHFTLEGRSRAGHETVFRIRELNLVLDIGRCPDFVVSVPNVFITHAHLDHGVGVPFYAGQRKLQRLDGGSIHVPHEAAAAFREILAIYERTSSTPFRIEIIGVAPGDVIPLGRAHQVIVHEATHRVAANAYEIVEIRHRLKSEFESLSHDEIQRRRAEVIEEVRLPILFYTGDTDRGLLERNDALYRADVLLIECTFLIDGHQGAAAEYRHIHFDDIAEFADRFENQMIVLTHFSRRYSRSEIHETVRRRCPAVLRERIRLALPEMYQRIT
jgi:ribonuclease Z